MHNKTLAPQRRSALRNHSRKAEVMRNKILCHSGVPAAKDPTSADEKHKAVFAPAAFQGQISVWR
jgi:hypothetical protein